MSPVFVLCKINYALLKMRQKIHKLLSILKFTSKPLSRHLHFAECPYIR